MNPISNDPSGHQTMEEGVNVLMRNVQQDFRHRYQKCENRIRKSPTTAVIGAAAIGYVLHRLPVRAILVTQVRVLAALTPPVLLLFGAAKLYDFLQRQEIAKNE